MMVTVMFPDNAEGSHSAVVVTQLVEKLGGKVMPESPADAAAATAGPAAPGQGQPGMYGMRPPGLRVAEAKPYGDVPPGP
jgi:hypothetical protein